MRGSFEVITSSFPSFRNDWLNVTGFVGDEGSVVDEASVIVNIFGSGAFGKETVNSPCFCGEIVSRSSGTGPFVGVRTGVGVNRVVFEDDCGSDKTTTITMTIMTRIDAAAR
jgi:hypothetical protein